MKKGTSEKNVIARKTLYRTTLYREFTVKSHLLTFEIHFTGKITFLSFYPRPEVQLISDSPEEETYSEHEDLEAAGLTDPQLEQMYGDDQWVDEDR